ncbi:MAG: sugar nucleotide-binding protein [Candidatus Hydrogenedentota bacterium]
MRKDGLILLTGGSGLLGRHLRALDPTIVAPPRAELDVSNLAQISICIAKYHPAIILHAAAMTRVGDVRSRRTEAIEANIVGTCRIAQAALEHDLRLVHLSSDYVYADTAGPHREDEPLLPANEYAWTKLGAEAAVRLVPDSLIIRTSFGPRPCEYDIALEDKITSRMYVDEIAPRMLKVARSSLTGIINLGGPAISMLDYARRTKDNVRSARLAELNEPIPRDTSLDLSRWNRFQDESMEKA